MPHSSEDLPRPRARRAYLNVSKRCNARCVYCSDWMNDRAPSSDHPAQAVMSLIDDLKALGVAHVTISGGEPLIRADLWEILDHIVNSTMCWSLITNGSMLTAQAGAQLLARKISHLNVSLDTLNSGRLRQLRGLSRERILRNLLRFQSLNREGSSPVPISILTVISRSNIHDLLDMARYCRSHGLGLTLQPMHVDATSPDHRAYPEHWPLEPDIASLERAIAEMIVGKHQSALPIENSDAYLRAIPDFFRRHTFRPPSPCTAGGYDIVLDTEFDVRPCWAMQAVEKVTPARSLLSIVNGPQYLDTQRAIRRGTCPGCLYSCHMNRQLAVDS